MVHLKRTAAEDLDFILTLEHRPDNRDFIGQWTRDEHVASMARADREHWTMVGDAGAPLGYLIAYDNRAEGFGIYIKRIAVADRSRGVGRAALGWFLDHVWCDTDAALVTLAVRDHNARAMHVYELVGFEFWPMTADERLGINTHVDPFGPDCLVMRAWRPAARS
jgi:ribosomal protein S18 acetylase RimI-like enzyme